MPTKKQPTKIKLLKEIGAFQPGEEHEVDDTNPFFLREKCERYVTNQRAEWVDGDVTEPQPKPEVKTDVKPNH
jgi:hypothetical protein